MLKLRDGLPQEVRNTVVVCNERTRRIEGLLVARDVGQQVFFV